MDAVPGQQAVDQSGIARAGVISNEMDVERLRNRVINRREECAELTRQLWRATAGRSMTICLKRSSTKVNGALSPPHICAPILKASYDMGSRRLTSIPHP